MGAKQEDEGGDPTNTGALPPPFLHACLNTSRTQKKSRLYSLEKVKHLWKCNYIQKATLEMVEHSKNTSGFSAQLNKLL